MLAGQMPPQYRPQHSEREDYESVHCGEGHDHRPERDHTDGVVEGSDRIEQEHDGCDDAREEQYRVDHGLLPVRVELGSSGEEEFPITTRRIDESYIK